MPAADAGAARGLEVGQGKRKAEPHAGGIDAGPDEHAARIRAMLADAGIDAVTAFHIEFDDGNPEAVGGDLRGSPRTDPSPWWHRCCGPMAGCPPAAAWVCRTAGSPSLLSALGVPQNAADGSRGRSASPHLPDLTGRRRRRRSPHSDREPAGGGLPLADAEALRPPRNPGGRRHRLPQCRASGGGGGGNRYPGRAEGRLVAPAHAATSTPFASGSRAPRR